VEKAPIPGPERNETIFPFLLEESRGGNRVKFVFLRIRAVFTA
jgi:hypothetical protein